MGFLNRFNKRNTRIGLNDNAPIFSNQAYSYDYVRPRRRNSNSILLLILLPLFLLLGLLAYSFLTNSDFNNNFSGQSNFFSKLINHKNNLNENNKNNGLQFGVGGSPVTPTPMQSQTSNQNNNIENQGSDVESGRVQSDTDRVIPSIAPATGRGGN